MANLPQASFPTVLDAGYMRLTQLGLALIECEDAGCDTERLEASICHLRFVLEKAALSSVAAERDAFLSYAQETYGLLAVATDPLLRSLRPLIPSTGVTVRARAFFINGRIARLNGKAAYAGTVLLDS